MARKLSLNCRVESDADTAVVTGGYVVPALNCLLSIIPLLRNDSMESLEAIDRLGLQRLQHICCQLPEPFSNVRGILIISKKRWRESAVGHVNAELTVGLELLLAVELIDCRLMRKIRVD